MAVTTSLSSPQFKDVDPQVLALVLADSAVGVVCRLSLGFS